MQIKVSELKERALDWAVTMAENWAGADFEVKPYSTDWAQGGPIIERECIGLRGPSIRGNAWAAFIDLSGISQGPQHRHTGPTPLIAAMRCYVASKLGDTVDIPDELAKG
jgi:hypothetical protein